MTYYLDPYGCVKNQVDAENMMAYLNEAGWKAADEAEHSDLIIVNSCGFIESAKRESINAVLNWKKLYPEKKILLAGCLAQRYAKELSESLPEADGLFGVEDLTAVPEAAAGVMRNEPRLSGRELPSVPEGASREVARTAARRPLLSLPGSAYVKISEGCNNRCSFCAIPIIRGALKSRSVEDITEECKTLLRRGVGELCLIGQDTGSYGLDIANNALPERALPGSVCSPSRSASMDSTSPGLFTLMEALSRLEGNFWVRILYTHPDHFPQPILEIMRRDKRFLPYFDIPFQHGSDKVLAAMNRRLNAGNYLTLIETIRRELPDAVIRSTFLTGFPGETDEDFALLLDFQKKAGLDWLGCFAYSREEGTPAYSMKNRVAKKNALKRKRLVEELQVHITEKQMDRFTGRSFEVLVEEKFDSPTDEAGSPAGSGLSLRESESLYLGRLPCQAPEVDGAAVIFSPRLLALGAKVFCKVIGRRGFDMEVRPV
jgi:ribosomal protein S12 methylthiotransferase